MNSTFMRWLLDVQDIPADAEGVRLAWEHAVPGWLWAGIVVLLLLGALWSYSRMTGSRSGRGALAGVRAATLVLASMLLAGPMLEMPRESVEPDWVLFLADRSRSMEITDAMVGGARASRDAELESVLAEHAAPLGELAAQRHVEWLGFHAGAYALERGGAADGTSGGGPGQDDAGAAVPRLGDPSGRRTRLSTALEQALQRAAARPVSGVVVLSDGRTDDPPTRALLRRLQAERIPVHVVPLGSPEPVGDVALARVEAPRRAFVRDKVPVVVELDRFGSMAGDLAGHVALVDELTGETLDRVPMPQDADAVTLTAEPELSGETTWRVVLETDGADLVAENNSRSVAIDLVDRPLRVLYVDGYPRWEYRYLKNLLVREESIESSVMLLSADSDFAQEGNDPITRLPRTAAELAPYDVIILGDVPASFFTRDQLGHLLEHVADRGAGLLWVGGERHTPQSFAGTALADVLPVRGASAGGGGALDLAAIGSPVNMVPTPLADRLGVLRLVSGFGAEAEVGWPDELADPAFSWSSIYWGQRIPNDRLKAAAEVLAQTAQDFPGGPLPLVIRMRFGAGQSIYVATDEIWRWRYGRGETYPEQFWIQMIRMLGRDSLAAGGAHAALEVTPRRATVGQPVRVALRLRDERLIDDRRATVRAIVERDAAPDAAGAAAIELDRTDEEGAAFAGTLVPDQAGTFRVRITDPDFEDLGLVAPLDVYAVDDELRRPETDHETLARLASATDGAVLAPDELNALWAEGSTLLRNRAIRTSDPLHERIWDTPLAFVLLLVLLTVEWVGRKLLRLA